MKKTIQLARIALIISLFLGGKLFAQNNWEKGFGEVRGFIKNEGQFNVRHNSLKNEDIRYSYTDKQQFIHFTPSGLIYHFFEQNKNVQRKKGEKDKPRYVVEADLIPVVWLNANPNVMIEAKDAQHAYHSYSLYDNGKESVKSLEKIPGFDKIVYKELYKNIDVEYTIHPKSGIKYSLILHPGADISKVRMKYADGRELSIDQIGSLHVQTKFGDIIEQAPFSFYASDAKVEIKSNFKVTANEVSFNIGAYDKTKTLIVDPWVQSPNFNTVWDCVWECESDAAGNAYIIGGIMPLQLLKYNSTGVLQWTYTTPYDTSNTWLGNFATDDLGNSYVTEGTGGGTQKIGTGGTLNWNRTGNVGGILTEFWSIAFNCDQSKIVIGGTGGTGIIPQPYLYNMNPANGAVTSSLRVTGGALLPTQEVRSLTSCGNGKYYFLSHDSIGYVHQNLNTCLPSGSLPYHVSNTYNFGYKCENFRSDNSGIAAMKYGGGYVYTHRGNRLDKRDFNTSAILASVTIPGGQWNTGGFGSGNSVGCSGIDIDDCGNIYVGATNGVVKFNSNLVQQAIYATTFNVYDVAVSTSGNIIACGTTGTSSSGARTGSVQSFAASACVKVDPICCDATLCEVPTKCTSDPAVTLVATTAGGTFSGPGVTGSSFNPATAGVGVHTIKYTLACGSDSIKITVNNCAVLNVCKESNGQFTVTGGTGPYTWSVWDSIGRTCSGTVFLGNCLGTWTTNYGWKTFATGTTVTAPAGKDTIRVTDNSGGVYISYNKNLIPPCSSCNLAIQTKTVTQPSCGLPNGSISVTMTGGTLPYSYAWTPNVSTTNSASNLAAGSYRVVITAGAGCTKDTTFNLTGTTAPNINSITKTDELCQGQNNGAITSVNTTGGSPTYTYGYAPSSNPTAITPIASFPLNNLAPGTYILGVQDANSCRDTFWFTIAAGPVCCNLAIQSKTVTQPSCGLSNGAISVTMTGGTLPYSYAWTPNVSTTNVASNLATGSYQVVITAGAGCTKDTTFSLTGTTVPNINSITKTDELCQGQNNGAITAVNTTGGSPTYTYGYAPSSNPTAITPIASFPLNNLAPGTYILGVQDANSCRDTFWFTIAAGPVCCNLAIQSSSVSQPSCGQNVGSISVTMIGGTMPYTYTWTPNVSTTNAATNLAAGSYRVVISAGVGCTKDTTFTLSGSAPNINTVTTMAEVCQGQNNGAITSVNTTGGTPNYTYGYAPSSNPTAITPIASFPFNNLAPGTYILGVQDANSCRDTFWFTIAAGPLCCNLNATASLTQPACGQSNGAIDVTPSLGSGNYTYSWQPGGQTTEDLSSLVAGSYVLTLTDLTQNCSKDFTFNLSNIGGPVIDSVRKTDEVCFGNNNGTIQVYATGGSILTYTWAPTLTNSATQTNLSPGTYTFTVSDVNGCQAVGSRIILAGNNPQLVLTPTDPSCEGTNGRVVAVASPNGSYQFVMNGNTTNTTGVFENLGSGTYSIIATDVRNCTVSATTSIQAPTAFTASINAQDVTTFGGNDGAVTITIAGGNPPIVYAWSTGATVQNLNNLSAGVYTVTITDDANCNGVYSAEVKAPLPTNPDIRLPSAFTPNGDGTNDALKAVLGPNTQVVAMRVFNRWGEKVFESKDNTGWDGNYKGVPQSVETYIVHIEYKRIAGSDKVLYLMNSVSLLR